MSNVVDRTLIAQAVIALAACIGAWFVFVEPRSVEAQQLEQEILIGSQQAADIDQETIHRLAQRLDEVRSRIRSIDRRGDITRDSSHLYSVIMNLAREHAITIASLNPGTAVTRGSSGRASRSGGGNEDFAVHREVTVSFSGHYEDIAAFVDAVQSMRGYIEVQYLSVAAASGRDSSIVNARMTCRTVQFALPATLRELLGESDADAIEMDSEGEQVDA